MPSELSSDTGREGGGGAHALPLRRRPVRPVASCGRGWRGRSTARLIVISAADGDETTATRRGSVGVGLSRPACPANTCRLHAAGACLAGHAPALLSCPPNPGRGGRHGFWTLASQPTRPAHPPNTQLYSIVGQSLQIVSRLSSERRVVSLPAAYLPRVDRSGPAPFVVAAPVQHVLQIVRRSRRSPIGKHAACQPAAR